MVLSLFALHPVFFFIHFFNQTSVLSSSDLKKNSQFSPSLPQIKQPNFITKLQLLSGGGTFQDVLVFRVVFSAGCPIGAKTSLVSIQVEFYEYLVWTVGTLTTSPTL